MSEERDEEVEKYNETYCCYESKVATLSEQERDVREMWGIERQCEKMLREKLIAYLDKHNSDVAIRKYMFFTSRTDDDTCVETGKEYEIVYPHHFNTMTFPFPGDYYNKTFHHLVCKTYVKSSDGKGDCERMDIDEGWESRLICVELCGLNELSGIIRALDL